MLRSPAQGFVVFGQQFQVPLRQGALQRFLDGLHGQDGQISDQGTQQDHVDRALAAQRFSDVIGRQADHGDVIAV